MIITYSNYGQFSVSITYENGLQVDYSKPNGMGLEECMTLASDKMTDDLTITCIDIIDINTGEIAVVFDRDNEDFYDDYLEDTYYDGEDGFNPYLGCYDYDC